MATFVKAHKAAKDASKAVYEENPAFLNALTEDLNIFSTSVSCSRQTGSMSFSAYNLTQNQAEQLIRFADSIGILMKRS